jgi:hypothetical protein
MHIDGRDSDRHLVDPHSLAQRRHAFTDEADLEAGAAHVDRDEIGHSLALGAVKRSRGPRRRPRGQRIDGLAQNLVDGRASAVELDEKQMTLQAVGAQEVLEFLHVH